MDVSQWIRQRADEKSCSGNKNETFPGKWKKRAEILWLYLKSWRDSVMSQQLRWGLQLNHWLNLTNERKMRRAQKQPWKVNSSPPEALGVPATSSPSELVAWKPVWGQCICSLCTAPWNGRSRSNLLRPDAVQTKRRPRRAAGWKWTERQAAAAPGEVALAPFYTWLGNTCRTVRHMLPLPHGGPWRTRSTWS